MLGVANCGFVLVPITRSESEFLARFTSRTLLVEYMGIHAITELGSCAVEFEPFSQYAHNE